MKETLMRITLVILFLNAVVSCRGQDMQITMPAQPTNELVTQGTPQGVKAFEQRAMEAATQWRSDAYMTGAHAIIPASRPDGTFTIRSRVTFDFRSKADAQHWYGVDFDSKGALDVFEFSYTVPQSDDLPIESSDWPLDSVDAWQIVLADGGSTLLEEYRPQTIDMHCSVTLQRWSPQLKPSGIGRVLWYVSCFDAGTLRGFRFWIDAQTGEVVGKEAE